MASAYIQQTEGAPPLLISSFQVKTNFDNTRKISYFKGHRVQKVCGIIFHSWRTNSMLLLPFGWLWLCCWKTLTVVSESHFSFQNQSTESCTSFKDNRNALVFVSSVRSSYSHPDLLLIHHHHHQPLFQITPVLNIGLSLSEPLQLYKGYNAI